MTCPQTHTSWPQSDHICQLKRGFHFNCPARILPSSSLSKPHLPPCLRSGFPFFPSLRFSPFTVCLFCLLCFMWAASYASKLVKPESEAHTAPCLHRKLCRENLRWLSRSDTYITVCIFLCTLRQVTKPKRPNVRSFSSLWYCAHTRLHAYIHVCSLEHE